jgi:hypothetical protein
MEESQLHGDVLLENFVENYNNLTIKSLMMIKFVAQSNVNAAYIFKVIISYISCLLLHLELLMGLLFSIYSWIYNICWGYEKRPEVEL